MTKVKLGESFLCAIKGIFRGISQERNFRIQIFLGVVVIIGALIVKISQIYLITIILVTFLVLILEMFNRNFERLIDLVSPEYNKEAGEIKDTMAGIVLTSSILALVVGLIILYRPLINTTKALSGYPVSLALMIMCVALTLIIFVIYYIKRVSQMKASHKLQSFDKN